LLVVACGSPFADLVSRVQSTYCDNVRQHCETVGRTVHVANLGACSPAPALACARPCAAGKQSGRTGRGARAADPAAESFNYPVAFDLRDLVSLDDVMEELHLGPNGCAGRAARPAPQHLRALVGSATRARVRRGLLYCMEYLEENLDEWLGEELQARAPPRRRRRRPARRGCARRSRAACALPGRAAGAAGRARRGSRRRARAPPAARRAACAAPCARRGARRPCQAARGAQGYGEEDYVLFDCPGQVELYSHCSAFRALAEHLRREGWAAAAVYCIDCQFVAEPAKFVAGALQARAAPAARAGRRAPLLSERGRAARRGGLRARSVGFFLSADYSTQKLTLHFDPQVVWISQFLSVPLSSRVNRVICHTQHEPLQWDTRGKICMLYLHLCTCA